MMIILMMVLTIGAAAFADSYVAFTSKEGLALYNDYDNTGFNTWVKSCFEAGTSDCTDKEKEDSTLIIVVDNRRAIQCVWVVIDEKNPKLYWVCICDFYKNGELIDKTIESFNVETSSKTDPVLVGLNFIKEIVFQVNNIDKEKVVYQMAISE